VRPELAALVEEILRDAGKTIELDTIGEAIGARAITAEEIDGILATIEARGHTIRTRAGGSGESTLKTVLTTARALKSELGRTPTSAEIATRSGLALIDVQHALSLARIMQR
jgi:hypothetical protein